MKNKLWVLCVGMLLAMQVQAQRVALVVGNSSYADKPLKNPVNDALLMQRTLKDLGFEVSLVRNADRKGMLVSLREFEAKARGAEVALFYFAGHGAQVQGANYLIPVGSAIRSDTDVPDEAVEADSVLRRIESAGSRVGLVVLDACRDNPFAGSSRSGSRGLGRMNVTSGSIVAYATTPGSTADDGKGANGVYTEQLARQLKTPGLDIKEVFDRTAIEVERLTGGKQRPREDVGLRGRFVLNSAGGSADPSAGLAATPAGAPASPPVVVAALSPQAGASKTGRVRPSADGATVVDEGSGVVWARCSVGQQWTGSTCSGAPTLLKFDQVASAVPKGWRLPSPRELQSLVKCSTGFKEERLTLKDGGAPLNMGCQFSDDLAVPTLDQKLFNNAHDGAAWTSDLSDTNSAQAWYVHFGYGTLATQSRNANASVRLVRVDGN
jgi:uncharacterized protein (TIGR02145 family)